MSTTQEAAARYAPELEVPNPLDLPPLLPAQPDQEPGEAGERARAALRRFYVGKQTPEVISEDLFPALLHRFRDSSRLRMVYPLFLQEPQGKDTPACQSLSDLLADVGGSADLPRVLTDNLPRVERIVRYLLAGTVKPMAPQDILEAAREQLVKELNLRENVQGELDEAYQALVDRIPPGSLLACGPHGALHLLMQAVGIHYGPRVQVFREEVQGLIAGLKDLLLAEDEKRPDARSADALARAVGSVAQFLDPAALSAVLGPQRGAVRMHPDRERRIRKTIEVLEGWLAEPGPLVTIVHRTALNQEWVESFGWRVVQADNPCGRGAEVFDEIARDFAEVVRAVRVGRMEVEGTYDANMHDVWFQGFDWQAFTPEELSLLPVVVVYQRADSLARGRMVSFTRLLTSGRRVQLLLPVQAAENPGVAEGDDPFATFRIELGAVGVGLRQAFVQQSSSARPQHLVRGFLDALKGTRTALHMVAEDENPRLVHWLLGGSALESRAHPFFRFNPDKGTGLAQRFDFSENPEPDQDWPHYELAVRTPEGQTQTLDLRFTFADFALLHDGFEAHYMRVSPECPVDDLVGVAEWLELDPREALKRVPFVWAVDSRGDLVRVAITRQLAFVCRDRLSHWHTLQELAGINDEYALRAAREAREAALAEAAEERAALEAAHAEEIDRIRLEEADSALRRLSDALVAEDFAAALASGGGAPRPAARKAAPAPVAQDAPAPAAEAEPVEEEEDDDDLSFDEPYIDTFLCTSCNDCTAINPLLFVYDGNKQARIGDPRAGSFKELVMAAEKCPARCIHPGKPLNPDEPGLDELIRRAQPFN